MDAPVDATFDISIHAPREGGDLGDRHIQAGLAISIHAPREGGDRVISLHGGLRVQFQSTPPARGATTLKPGAAGGRVISIHAPREGGDGL